MITYTKKAGTTDVSVVIRIVDETLGTPETGVVFNTSGIDLEYRRELAASVDITEVTLAALTTAHSDGGFLHIGNGYYRLDLPDAACAAGATGVLVHGVVTGMVVIGCYIDLVAYDPYDVVRLGLTALPNAAAEASGGLFTRGSGLGQINQQANGQVDSNVERVRNGVINALTSGRVDVVVGAVSAGVIAAASFAAGAFDAVWTVAARLLTAGTNIVLDKGTGLTGLNDLSAAQVNAEVVDALATDTYPESTAAPAATTSLKNRIVWMSTLMRNKITQTATTQTLRDDADSAAISQSTVSDDGTTFTRGEWT